MDSGIEENRWNHISPATDARSSGKPASEHLSLVEVFEMVAPPEEYRPAVSALTQRVEKEGPAGLVTYQLYADTASGEGGALITFADPDDITRHMHLISQWEEFRRFVRTIKLVDMRIYGVLSPDAEAWLAQGSYIPNKRFPDHVSGFVRREAKLSDVPAQTSA
jgi:hypothetical protein